MGLDDASGYISVVGTAIGEQITAGQRATSLLNLADSRDQAVGSYRFQCNTPAAASNWAGAAAVFSGTRAEYNQDYMSNLAAHVIVDGPVDAPDTLGKLLGDKFDAFKQGKGHEGVIDPAALAETYWHLAHQPRNCWSHEVDVRPWTDTPWWNDNPDPQIDSKGKGFAGPRTD